MNRIIQILEILLLVLLLIVVSSPVMKPYDPMTATVRNGKIEIKRTGADHIHYYFSMSDTLPTFPADIRHYFSIPDADPTYPSYPRRNAPIPDGGNSSNQNTPHIALFQGDPLHLHSFFCLENFAVMGDDSISAIMGVVDGSGNTNNAMKITPGSVIIQTSMYNDTLGGTTYSFTRDGIVFRNGGGKRNYVLPNKAGLAGQVLMMNNTSDTAYWSYTSHNLSSTGLHNYKSIALAVAAGLHSGDAFILDSRIGGDAIKIIAFVP